jgi:polyisoprenoid-binding protein YceI
MEEPDAHVPFHGYYFHMLDGQSNKAPGGINGTMAFDRKEFGMNSGIPFIKGKRVSGPPLNLKK